MNKLDLFVYKYVRSFPKRVKCPCCGWSGVAFIGFKDRDNEICPSCQSKGRHRFLYLLLERVFRNNKLPPNPKILHIAPEVMSIGKFLKHKVRDGYLSIDLNAKLWNIFQ